LNPLYQHYQNHTGFLAQRFCLSALSSQNNPFTSNLILSSWKLTEPARKKS